MNFWKPFWCWILTRLLVRVNSFSVSPTSIFNSRSSITVRRGLATNNDDFLAWKHQMLPDMNSFLTGIEIFDGSTVVDPVVVSDVYWTSLQSKILTVIIGQILAAITFAILASLLASQLSRLGDFITKTFSSSLEKQSSSSGKKFVKLNEVADASNNPTPDFGKLVICIAIDIIGSSSELVPLLGEVTDVIYAPIAATILRSIYGGSNVLFVLELAEEILPFTDILPLATICWVVDTFFYESELARVLQLGQYNKKLFVEDAIDTKAEPTQILLPKTRTNEKDG